MWINKIIRAATLLLVWIGLTGCGSSQQPETTPTDTPSMVTPSAQSTSFITPGSPATVTPNVTLSIETLAPSPAATETPTLTLTPSPTSLPPVPLGWLAVVDYWSGSPNISIARTDGRGARTIVGFFAGSPYWSLDGQWIAMQGTADRYSGETALYLAHADGSSFALLLSQDGSVANPSWSPDGRFIVYRLISNWANDQDGFSVDLFVVEVSTGLVQRLTNTPGISEYDPVYSPDGSRIAFAAADENAHFDLMVMDANGEIVTQLTHSPFDNSSPSWSPDGQRIAFVSGDGCGAISVINADGSGLQQLPSGPGYARYPAWSPDGEWIVFTSSPCMFQNNLIPFGVQGSRVYAVRADGSGLQELPIPGDVLDPTWSPLPALQSGGRYAVTELGEGLNLRASPALDGEVVEKLHEGDEILVLEGPVDASQYLWWRVRLGDGDLEGWVAENPGWFMNPGD